MLLFGKRTTANLYSHLEYNAKVNSAETIARVLGGNPAPKSEPEKTAEKKTASKKSTAKTASDTVPKKTRGRKKKSDNPTKRNNAAVTVLHLSFCKLVSRIAYKSRIRNKSNIRLFFKPLCNNLRRFVYSLHSEWKCHRTSKNLPSVKWTDNRADIYLKLSSVN